MRNEMCQSRSARHVFFLIAPPQHEHASGIGDAVSAEPSSGHFAYILRSSRGLTHDLACRNHIRIDLVSL